MSTYNITEKVSGPVGKFACMVSFNGKTAHYYEMESLDPKEIDAQLQATADADELKTSADAAKIEEADSVVIEKGKIKV